MERETLEREALNPGEKPSRVPDLHPNPRPYSSAPSNKKSLLLNLISSDLKSTSNSSKSLKFRIRILLFQLWIWLLASDTRKFRKKFLDFQAIHCNRVCLLDLTATPIGKKDREDCSKLRWKVRKKRFPIDFGMEAREGVMVRPRISGLCSETEGGGASFSDGSSFLSTSCLFVLFKISVEIFFSDVQPFLFSSLFFSLIFGESETSSYYSCLRQLIKTPSKAEEADVVMKAFSFSRMAEEAFVFERNDKEDDDATGLRMNDYYPILRLCASYCYKVINPAFLIKPLIFPQETCENDLCHSLDLHSLSNKAIYQVGRQSENSNYTHVEWKLQRQFVTSKINHPVSVTVASMDCVFGLDDFYTDQGDVKQNRCGQPCLCHYHVEYEYTARLRILFDSYFMKLNYI